MSKSTLASVTVIALALAGGVALWVTKRGDDAPRGRPRAERVDESKGSPEPHAAPDDLLNRRVSALEARVARLERAAGVALSGAATRTATDEQDDNVVDNPVFEAAVRDVVGRVEGEQDEQRRERRRQRMAAWSRETTDELSERLELEDPQRGRIQSILDEHFSRIVELRDTASRADGGAGLRTRFREARDALDRQIDEVLTPAQRREAEALREKGEFPGQWGRRRR